MKAIITDLDRTLLRTDKSISEYTCAVLKKCHDRGMLLMAATARPERAVLTYRSQVGFDALTTLNGARIILPSGVLENGIAPRSAEAILRRVVDIPMWLCPWRQGKGLSPINRFRNGTSGRLKDFRRCPRKAPSIRYC